MAFFSRKPKELDATFPQLTLQQGVKMRQISVDVLTSMGYGVEVADDHVVTSDGRMYGLETVARTIPNAPEREWKPMLEDYFARMTAKAAGSIIDAMPAEDLLARTRAKIIDPTMVTQEQALLHYNYTQWVGGLPLLMAYDGEETINYLRDDHVQRAGEDRAWDAARANLLAEGSGTPQPATDEEGGSFLGIMSDSEFQATWLAFPAELLDSLGLTAGPLGVFMTVPAATALNLHVINDETGIADLLFMTRVTGAQHDGMPHPLSPHVYWWNGGQVQPITGIVDGDLAMVLPDELEHLASR